MFGNMRSHSERKVRRNWKPNVQTKKFFSPLLNKSIRLRVTTRALRTIDKLGGIDEYLLKTRREFLGHYDDSLGVTLKKAVTDRYNSVVGVSDQYIEGKTRPGNRRLCDLRPNSKKSQMPRDMFLDNVIMPSAVKTRVKKRGSIVIRTIRNTRTNKVYTEMLPRIKLAKSKSQSKSKLAPSSKPVPAAAATTA